MSFNLVIYQHRQIQRELHYGLTIPEGKHRGRHRCKTAKVHVKKRTKIKALHIIRKQITKLHIPYKSTQIVTRKIRKIFNSGQNFHFLFLTRKKSKIIKKINFRRFKYFLIVTLFLSVDFKLHIPNNPFHSAIMTSRALSSLLTHF